MGCLYSNLCNVFGFLFLVMVVKWERIRGSYLCSPTKASQGCGFKYVANMASKKALNSVSNKQAICEGHGTTKVSTCS